jgi:precorrin-6x reductase cbiJ/cobK
MVKVLIYSGTTEGRMLAQQLAQAGIECDVHVATEYGQIVMPQLDRVNVHVGRLDANEMYEAARNGYAAVVDATHPFATEVSANIRKSLETLDVPYIRLARKMDIVTDTAQENEGGNTGNRNSGNGHVRYFADYESCAAALEATDGNILLTTGSKELGIFCNDGKLCERLYVRVLPGQDNIALCEAAGIRGKQIIAMQGPFSTEMNTALINQFSIKYLVTKASGEHSGFAEKLEAARNCGIEAFVIGMQAEDKGLSYDEVLKRILRICNAKIKSDETVRISLIGIGVSGRTLTGEAQEALNNAGLVFGAGRMLDSASAYIGRGAACYPYYMAKDIIPVIKRYENDTAGMLTAGGDMSGSLNAAVLFSGDTGFYSGAAKLKEALEAEGYTRVTIYPGISSVSYLAAATGNAWQNAKLLSIHGMSDKRRAEALVKDAVRCNERTFVLVSGRDDVQRVSAWVSDIKAGCSGDSVMGSIRIIAGYNLGYDDEKITEPATSGDIAGQNGLYTLLILNDRPERKRLVPGICDEEFRRDMKVPMTKKEIRVAAISSLEIRSGAVVYDIGSGTGSIAVECAMLSPDIKVYAFECNEKAQKLLRENMERFGTANVYPVDGMAPEVLDTEGLEPPTNVFIGGSKGQLEDIVEKVWKLNPEAVIVISAVTLETLARITGLAEKSTDDEYNVRCEVVQMQVNQVRQAGSYHMMQGTNPVFLCVLKRV